MTKILSSLNKIARTISISVHPIEYVNNIIDVSVVHQVYGRLPQLKFITNELIKPSSNNNQIDTSYGNETGHGAIQITPTKDFYMGEGSK